MKIIQVVHAFYPSIGGIEQHAYHLSRALVRKGHEVVVYTTGKGEEIVDGIRVKRFGAFQFPFFSSVNLSVGLAHALLSLRKEHADVVAVHGYGNTMPGAAVIARWRDIPVVFTLHGYPKLKGLGRILQHGYRAFYAPLFLKRASRIITVSMAAGNELLRDHAEVDPRKILHIPNGVGREFFKVRRKPTNAIAYVGRFDRYKRIDLLIEAFAELKKEFPELRLQLIGKDEGIRKKLEDEARQLGVQIEFKESKPNEMPGIYAKLKAVVLPSAYEGFSLVWLEAMATGCPMFSTPVGEAPELFSEMYGRNSDWFLFTDSGQLVGKLRIFLKNEKAYMPVLQKARQRVQKRYSWKTVAERTVKLYQMASK